MIAGQKKKKTLQPHRCYVFINGRSNWYFTISFRYILVCVGHEILLPLLESKGTLSSRIKVKSCIINCVNGRNISFHNPCYWWCLIHLALIPHKTHIFQEWVSRRAQELKAAWESCIVSCHLPWVIIPMLAHPATIYIKGKKSTGWPM